MKYKIGGILISTLRILASAWLGFLVAFLPLYIFRGTYHNADAALWEDVLMSAVGIIAGALILMVLTARTDRYEKIDDKQMFIEVGGAAGVYSIAWIIAWFFGGNNYLVSASGYHLSRLIDANEKLRPTFLGMLGGLAVCCAVYMAAIVVGARISRQRNNKERNK